jgi:hypothetical protein
MCKLTFDMSSLIFHSGKITKRHTGMQKVNKKEGICQICHLFCAVYKQLFSSLTTYRFRSDSDSQYITNQICIVRLSFKQQLLSWWRNFLLL